ncbi:MAG: hypothetical protein NVS3B5_19070 [Sphingomicrobium sp.]
MAEQLESLLASMDNFRLHSLSDEKLRQTSCGGDVSFNYEDAHSEQPYNLGEQH